jgi:hypothetical protein
MTNAEKMEAITAALVAEKMGDRTLLREFNTIISDETAEKISKMGYRGGAVDAKLDAELQAFLLRSG